MLKKVSSAKANGLAPAIYGPLVQIKPATIDRPNNPITQHLAEQQRRAGFLLGLRFFLFAASVRPIIFYISSVELSFHIFQYK